MNWAYLIHDHTLGWISRPVSGTTELLWRVKTYSRETLGRLKLKFYDFPMLERTPVPEIDPARTARPAGVMHEWLVRNMGKPLRADLRLMTDGERFFRELDRAIATARKSIDFNTYIFDNDATAVMIADRLREKSETARVRVLLDIFASRYSWKRGSLGRSPQGEPVSNIVRYLKRGSRVRVRRTHNLWLTSNHVKAVLIDRDRAFFGGMNIADEYRFDWRDMMVEVRGQAVSVFRRSFIDSWTRSKLFSDFRFFFGKLRSRRRKTAAGALDCHVLVTTPFRRQIYRAQLHAIRSARHHIYVENPYFWNYRFIYALCEARKRGVDVRVTLSSKIDIRLYRGACRMAVNTLLRHGVRVFLYPGMTHVKAAVMDGFACFGTANYDDLSLHKNFELNFATCDPGFVLKLERDLLVPGQERSREVREPLPHRKLDAFWTIMGLA
jgi:cardiolipin synthase